MRASLPANPSPVHHLQHYCASMAFGTVELPPCPQVRCFGGKSMLRLAILFAILALLFGVMGFGGAAAIAWDGARILFWIFVVLLVVSLIFGGLSYRQPPPLP